MGSMAAHPARLADGGESGLWSPPDFKSSSRRDKPVAGAESEDRHGVRDGAGTSMAASWRAALVAGAALIAAGCSSGPLREIFMMPVPAAYDQTDVPFGVVAADGGEPAYLDMLFATNRAPSAGGKDDPWYTGERGYLLRVGAARIAFGDGDITWERARELSLLKERPDDFPLRVTGVQELGILPDSVTVFTPPGLAPDEATAGSRQFAQAVNERLSRSVTKDVFVYVHGYKVVFENPLLVSSELWHFLGYEGAFVAFSWPSTPSRLAYFKDVETARLSAWGLRRLLEYLARETDAERIHIIGYSAGTRVVINALHELALELGDQSDEAIRAKTKLGEVIIIGSDVDTGIFASYMLDGMLRVPERLTLYESSTDKALGVSEKVFRHRRMGELKPGGAMDEPMLRFLRANPRLALVDITGADGFDEGNGHAYFRKSPWVSTDVLMTLRYGLGPADRGLVPVGDGLPVWRFPPDYTERFSAALSQGRLRSPASATPAQP